MRRVLLSLVVILVAGCRSGSNVAPPNVTPPQAPEPPKVTVKGGLPVLHVLFDEPVLAQARAYDRSKDWVSAAKVVHDVRPANAEPCAWDFLEGRMAWLATINPEAKNREATAVPKDAAALLAQSLAAFDRASNPVCPLSSIANVRTAMALARSGRADDAIARAKTAPDDDDAKMVIADSLAAKNDRAGAVPLWRSWLTANPHGSRWVDTSVRMATALLDNVEGEGKAREAYDLATRVIIEAPKIADSSGATAARSRAVGVLRAADPSISEALSDAERAKQAQAWLDANEPQKAFDLASSLVKSSAACRASVTRANAAAKKTPKADMWSDAVSACEKDADLVTALYAGAKARTNKDPRLALEWFAKVEQMFPTHRLADDARFRAALLVAQGSEEGREDKSEQMLRSLPDAYPAGDMKTEALFRVALAKLQKNRPEEAKPLLDRIIELSPDDRHWATAGRAEYFRARAAALTGDAEGARTRWEHIIEKHPLSFYMLLSYARLADGKSVLEKAIARDKEGAATFPSKPQPLLETPAFGKAVRLLEVSDIEGAKKELSTAGLTAEGVDPEVLWSVGAIYNQAGYYELGHAFSRVRLNDHLEHYPEGKWKLPWETAYPRAFEPMVRQATEKYTLAPAVAWGIMREESSFIADVKSPANAYGLMQLIIPTAKGVAIGTGFGSDEAALKRPEVSIELGTKFLAGLKQMHGHLALAIGAYNGGSGSIGKWMGSRTSDELDFFVENVPFEETRNYIKRVLSSVAAYGYLYDRKTFDDALALPLRLASR